MAEVQYSASARLPIDAIWSFVRDMENWAGFVTGYQHHEKKSETESAWTLKGDVGAMSRTLRFRVLITEWSGPERVRFTLEGENEPMRGEGRFELAPYTENAAADPAPRPGLWRRFLAAIARLLFRRAHGEGPRATSSGAGPGEGAARLTLHLRLEPGGPMAPMVNAMIAPLLTPAAENLTERILAAVEQRRTAAGG